MAITDLQKRTAKAIISCFETGKPTGNPAALTVLPDGAGISYGIHQATLNSGSLYGLLSDYCATASPENAALIKPYLQRLLLKEQKLNSDDQFKGILKHLGKNDPHMADTQEAYFDRTYWTRAVESCERLGLKLALSHAVVYDGCIQGAFGTIRDKVPINSPADGGDEKSWITAYVAARHKWLATHPKQILHKTVYRMEAFQQLIAAGNWDLRLPLAVRGVAIIADQLGGE